jgi:SAM-dependent methyltransferase
MRRLVTRTRDVSWLTAVAWTLGVVLCGTAHAASAAQTQEARDQWQHSAEVVEAVGATPGARVADVGCGDGFYTVRLARAVGPEGRVYAVDVSSSALDRLRAHLEREKLTNVEVIQGAADDPRLPAGLDGVLIVNAYHEMADHQAMLRHIRQALKPTGRLVLVEPMSGARREESRAQQAGHHVIAPRFAEDDLLQSEFQVARLEDPFAALAGDSRHYWLILARPREAEAAASPGTAEKGSTTPADAPELRISLDELDRLQRTGDVVILDVRGADAYCEGHIPGARAVDMSDLAGVADSLKQVTGAIVTYCD